MPRPFGPYQLLRRIAVGGMAEVYVALAKGVSGFEKLVALKLVHTAHSEDEHFVRMLVDEAKLSVLLGHANIAQTFDLGSVDGRFYIVMEYVDGVDVSRLLDRVLARRARLPIEAGLFIAARVCQALDYAHRKTDPSGVSLGVIHRDVSPQNILLSRDGEVKLTDFGIAKAALRTSETEVGVIKGKYCYMSPEQAWADPVDHRSDIYSAAAVLYELLTGRMLVSPDDNLPALLERVRRAELSLPSTLRPEITPDIDAILSRALARKASDRYETAADFSADLERALWARDRTWGSSRLKKLMEEFVPTDATGADLLVSKDRRDMSTKATATHTSMKSQEYIPEMNSSMLYKLPSDMIERLRDSEAPERTSRPTGQSTLRNLVERSYRQTTDPRVERPVSPAVPPARGVNDADDEDEATTFFNKADFATSDEANIGGADEDESTIIDASGDIAKRLDEMISLGGARATKLEPIGEEEQQSARTVAFVPPKPRWASLPFVGPPLPPEEASSKRESLAASSAFVAGRGAILAVAALAVLAIVLGAALALK